MEQRKRDHLLQALAEYTSFYADECRNRKSTSTRYSQAQKALRDKVLGWLRTLSAMQRAAVCSTVDVPFIRLMIQIRAAPKSKSMHRMDEFQVMRPSSSSAKLKDAPRPITFTRRPIIRSQDGDELRGLHGTAIEQQACAFLDNIRLFNTSKSCDTLSPSILLTNDFDSFVSTMDILSHGHFLSAAPDTSKLKGNPWTELPWLAQRGYYPLATYLVHQFELNIWTHFFNHQHVPTVGMEAFKHVAAEWQHAASITRQNILRRLATSTTAFIKELCIAPTWSSLKTSLNLLYDVMDSKQSQNNQETWFSCSLNEAGTQPHCALVKLLWAEELQKECALLLSESLENPTSIEASVSRKQLKKKAQSKLRKAKQKDQALHRSRLRDVLIELKQTLKRQQKQKIATLALVTTIVSELVDQVCAVHATPTLRKPRPKKRVKKPLELPSPMSPGQERRPGFLLLNLNTPPVTPPSFYEPFKSTRHFFPDPTPFTFTMDPPPPAHHDETFFLPELFQEDEAVAPCRTSDGWTFPTLNTEWQHRFDWRHTETRLPSWLEPSSGQKEITPPPQRSDQSTQADDNSLADEVQSVLDQQSKALTVMQQEISHLQHTVRELQSTIFTLQSSDIKHEVPPTRFNGLFVSVPMSLLPPKTKLHWDICEFVSHLQAETQNRLPAQTAVSRFCVTAVQALWPRAQVRAYGSFVTGLSLPSSDLDLVICLPKVRRDEPAEAPGVLEGRNAIKETWQQNLARKLRSESWVVPESVKTIPNASIPIITLLTTAPYHVRLDISFEGPGHNGLATNDLVHSFVHELPALAPLMLVLKTFIIDRGLGVAYTGGLSSYALLLMTTRFLQEFELHNRHQDSMSTQCNLVVSTHSRADFGTMLLGFMDFYGSKFDQRQTGISVSSRCFLDRDALAQHSTATSSTAMWPNVPMEHVQFENLNLSSPGSRRQNLHRDHGTGGPPQFKPSEYDPHKFDPLYIEDPLRPGNNVGRNCFRIMQIRRALATAWATLNEAPLTLPSNTYCGGVSLHPNNLLRSILTCTKEPKYKPQVPFVQSPPVHYQHHHMLSSPLRHIPPHQRQLSATKSKKQRQQMPQRRHSECVNDVQSISLPHVVADDVHSPSSARSLSFADVVVKQFRLDDDNEAI